MGANIFICNKPSIVWIDNLGVERLDSQFYHDEFLENERKILESGCDIRTISEISFKVNQGPNPVFEENMDGVPCLKTRNLYDDQINFDGCNYVSMNEYQKYKKFKIEYGDLLISILGEGSIGKCNIYVSNRTAIFNRPLALLKVKKSEVDEFYLSVYLRSSYGKKFLERGISGSSGQKVLGMDYIKKILVPIPSTEIQKYIGDKVRKAEELKEEASQLKKEMEDIITTQLKLDDLESELNDIKDKFVWESIGNIIGRLDSIYYRKQNIKTVNHMKNLMGQHKYLSDFVETIYTGKKPTFKERGEEVFFVQSGNISNNFLEFNETIKVDISSYKTLNFGDILVAKDGETIGKIAVNFSNNKSILNEHTYCLKIKEQYKAYGAYIYYLFTNRTLNNLIRRESTGSAQKGLNQDFVNWIPVPLIDEMEIIRIMNTEKRRCNNIYEADMLIKEAKQDIEDLIEGTFDMSKLNENSIERR